MRLSSQNHEREIMPIESMPPGHVACDVEEHHSAWLVTFDDGCTLLLQSDYDQAAFAVSCGAVESTPGWDGSPSKLPDPQAFYDLDCSSITSCLEDYQAAAESEAE